MNTYTLSISTNSYNGSLYEEELVFFDETELTINFLNLYNRSLPSFIGVDWGDGSPLFTPPYKLIRDYKQDSIFSEILLDGITPMLADSHTHSYTPSTTSIVKALTASIVFGYVSGDTFTIYIPIKVRTQGFYESEGDLKLADVTILPKENSPSNFVFITEKTGHVVELNDDC